MPDWAYTMMACCLAALIIGYIAGWAWDEWKNR
jgi:hypothetical protein